MRRPRPEAPFDGGTPLHVMLERGIPGLDAVRRYVDAAAPAARRAEAGTFWDRRAKRDGLSRALPRRVAIGSSREGDEDLEDLRAIADLTNPHALAEMGAIELVRPEDRIYGSGAGLIMAAFAWPGRPSRFSDGERGTCYAALAEVTAVAETVHHDGAFLAGAGAVVLEKTLIEADLAGTLVDVRRGRPAPPDV